MIGADHIPTVNLVIGILCAMLVAMVLLGGIKRIGSVSEKLVPFMALLYVLLGLGVVVLNITRLPGVLTSVFVGAFDPKASRACHRQSVHQHAARRFPRHFLQRGRLGTGSIAHACADTKKPVKQGVFGIFEVFVDTIVICTLTALVILCSGTAVNYGTMAGADLTISGFTTTYGSWASIFSAVALCCFAFSTIIGWAFTARVLWNFCSAPVRPCARSSSFIRSSQSSAQPSTLTCCGTSPIPLTA